jgi:hypothetical protein
MEIFEGRSLHLVFCGLLALALLAIASRLSQRKTSTNDALRDAKPNPARNEGTIRTFRFRNVPRHVTEPELRAALGANAFGSQQSEIVGISLTPATSDHGAQHFSVATVCFTTLPLGLENHFPVPNKNGEKSLPLGLGSQVANVTVDERLIGLTPLYWKDTGTGWDVE